MAFNPNEARDEHGRWSKTAAIKKLAEIAKGLKTGQGEEVGAGTGVKVYAKTSPPGQGKTTKQYEVKMGSGTHVGTYKNPEEAAAAALHESAVSSHPQSLGGHKSYGNVDDAGAGIHDPKAPNPGETKDDFQQRRRKERKAARKANKESLKGTSFDKGTGGGGKKKNILGKEKNSSKSKDTNVESLKKTIADRKSKGLSTEKHEKQLAKLDGGGAASAEKDLKPKGPKHTLSGVRSALGAHSKSTSHTTSVKGWHNITSGWEVNHGTNGSIVVSHHVGQIMSKEGHEKSMTQGLDRYEKTLRDKGFTVERKGNSLVIPGDAQHIEQVQKKVDSLEQEIKYDQSQINHLKHQAAQVGVSAASAAYYHKAINKYRGHKLKAELRLDSLKQALPKEDAAPTDKREEATKGHSFKVGDAEIKVEPLKRPLRKGDHAGTVKVGGKIYSLDIKSGSGDFGWSLNGESIGKGDTDSALWHLFNKQRPGGPKMKNNTGFTDKSAVEHLSGGGGAGKEKFTPEVAKTLKAGDIIRDDRFDTPYDMTVHHVDDQGRVVVHNPDAGKKLTNSNKQKSFLRYKADSKYLKGSHIIRKGSSDGSGLPEGVSLNKFGAGHQIMADGKVIGFVEKQGTGYRAEHRHASNGSPKFASSPEAAVSALLGEEPSGATGSKSEPPEVRKALDHIDAAENFTQEGFTHHNNDDPQLGAQANQQAVNEMNAARDTLHDEHPAQRHLANAITQLYTPGATEKHLGKARKVLKQHVDLEAGKTVTMGNASVQKQGHEYHITHPGGSVVHSTPHGALNAAHALSKADAPTESKTQPYEHPDLNLSSENALTKSLRKLSLAQQLTHYHRARAVYARYSGNNDLATKEESAAHGFETKYKDEKPSSDSLSAPMIANEIYRLREAQRQGKKTYL